MPYKSDELADPDILLLWALDEASGTSAVESVSGADTGTATRSGILGGAVGIPADGAGNAALFAGGSDAITMATFTALPTGDADWTMRAWVNLTSVSVPAGVLSWGDLGTGTDGIELAVNSATDVEGYSNGNSIEASGLAGLTGAWHQLAVAYDHATSTGTVFIDDLTPVVVTGLAAYALVASTLLIGSNAVDDAPVGAVAYVTIYGTAKGGTWAATRYTAGITATRTVQLTDTIVNGALVPQAGITVTATLSVPGSATPVDSGGREIDLTPLTDVTDIAGTYLIDRAAGTGVIAPADIKQNSGGTLIALPGCSWTISYLTTVIVSPEFAWSGTPIHPSSWVAPLETLGRFKMWLTDINGNGVVRPGVTFGCSVNANTTWTGGAGAGQLISSAGQFAVTTDSDGNVFLWVIRVSEFADAGRYYNLVELSGGSGGSATFVAPDTYTGDQGVYNGGTTYAANDVVRRASDDVPFISQAGSNVGHALTDPSWWLVYNGEQVTLHTFLVGAPGTQVADTSMIAMADTTDAGDATAYAAPFTLAKQIKHIFYAIRHLLGAETLLSGKAAVIASPTSTQTGNIDMAGNITAAGELLSPLGLAAAHMAGYYASKAVTAAINANAGTGASVSHIEGGDSEGRITIVTGSGAWASGIQASVTFHTDYITATGVIVTLAPDDDATLAAWPTVRPRSIDGQIHKFDISFGVADTAAHTYKFKWVCHGE